MADSLMIQGTMSGAGKSLLCTALCRIFHQEGWRVTPFKSQNMALNSAVTAEGLELGRAQAVQAEAAGLEPDVRMNPVLLKPEGDTGSQVVLRGIARGHMEAAAYFRYRRQLLPEILQCYNSLAKKSDLMVIEGAGSPAEINLQEHDIVNMGLAEAVHAPVLLAGDIDRGGVFAQLYGTVSLLDASQRRRVRGFLINKFRGDVSLLRPGLARLEELTGIPVLGVIPWMDAELDPEDSLSPVLGQEWVRKAVDIAVIRFPRISNFTDFAPLERHPGLGVRYVRRASALGTPDLLILPGTKNTLSDLLWLRQSGLEAAVLSLANQGTPVLGICGGYQMLGERLEDPEGVEGSIRTLQGLNLLPCVTRFAREKVLGRVRAEGCGIFEGVQLEGYEIHTGRTEVRGDPFCRLSSGEPEGCRKDTVWGTCLHGLFDRGAVVDALAAYLYGRKGIPLPEAVSQNARAFREQQYDLMASAVREAMDLDAVKAVIREGAP